MCRHVGLWAGSMIWIQTSNAESLQSMSRTCSVVVQKLCFKMSYHQIGELKPH